MRFWKSATLICLLGGAYPATAPAAEFGANKYDLVLQYMDRWVPGGSNAEGYRRVRRAMADKSIADARDAGFKFLRVGVTGYDPAGYEDALNDLTLWRNDPSTYWAELDRMFDELDRSQMRIVPSFLWNIVQFPTAAKDDLGAFVRDRNSASRRLFVHYITDFVTRYRSRKTILFYELTNEMNNLVDLNERANCPKAANTPCVWNNFSTADMVSFSQDLVALTKSLDPTRRVASGFSVPRPAAAHLAIRPGYSPRGPDWTEDSPEQFKRHLLAIHEPFDIVSVHIYSRADNDRFGRGDGQEYKLVADAEAAARSAGKTLYVSEWGDAGPGSTPFETTMLDEMARDRVEYSAIWAWEFYQTSTWRTYDTDPSKYNVEPGYSDRLIAMIQRAERAVGEPSPAVAADAPPRVVLTWPLPCAAVAQPIDLFAVASDGAHAVKSVEFLVDGKPIASSAAPPYSAHFDPAGLGAKTAVVEARAAGASGASSGFASQILLNGAKTSCDPTR